MASTANVIDTQGYATFWARVAACLIDALIMTVVGAVAGGILGAVIGGSMGAQGADPDTIQSAVIVPAYAFGLVLNLVYFAGMESSSRQATFGKSALGLVVTTMQGERLSFGRAAGRYLGKILSGLILGIGYVMIGFTDKKQGLHDLVASTLVLKK